MESKIHSWSEVSSSLLYLHDLPDADKADELKKMGLPSDDTALSLLNEINTKEVLKQLNNLELNISEKLYFQNYSETNGRRSFEYYSIEGLYKEIKLEVKKIEQFLGLDYLDLFYYHYPWERPRNYTVKPLIGPGFSDLGKRSQESTDRAFNVWDSFVKNKKIEISKFYDNYTASTLKANRFFKEFTLRNTTNFATMFDKDNCAINIATGLNILCFVGKEEETSGNILNQVSKAMKMRPCFINPIQIGTPLTPFLFGITNSKIAKCFTSGKSECKYKLSSIPAALTLLAVCALISQKISLIISKHLISLSWLYARESSKALVRSLKNSDAALRHELINLLIHASDRTAIIQERNKDASIKSDIDDVAILLNDAQEKYKKWKSGENQNVEITLEHLIDNSLSPTFIKMYDFYKKDNPAFINNELTIECRGDVELKVKKESLYFVIHSIILNSVKQFLKRKEIYNPCVCVYVANKDKEIDIYIRDNGPGVPVERWEEIFYIVKHESNLFNRSNELKDKMVHQPGMGYSLALARGIIREDFQGDIVVVNEKEVIENLKVNVFERYFPDFKTSNKMPGVIVKVTIRK